MEDKKLFGRTCPECGEIYQDCEFTNVLLGPGAQINMRCANDHKWSEFYNLDYRGYWYAGKIYDSYGEIKNT